jgi:hypothetical protein
MQQCWYCANYAAHEALLGPAGSTSPEDSTTWTVVADSTDLDISGEASSSWFEGYAIPLPGIASGDAFRVAFRYTGQYADKWYLEDLCVTTDATGSDPECVWSYGFDDCTSLGTLLGTGWTQVDGADDESSETWRTSVDTYVSSPTSATIDNDYYGYVDNYLVSVDIEIP